MSEFDPPIPGDLGEASEPPDQGALLYDPTAPLDLDEIEGYEESQRGRPLSMPLVGLAVVAVGIGGFLYLRSAGQVDPMGAVDPDVAPIEAVPAGQDRLVAVPTATLQGPVGSSVRVAVRVEGPAGAVRSDIPIRFEIQSGPGELSGEDVRSNGDGIGAAELSLPRSPGVTMITASVPDSEIAATRIMVTTVAGTPATIRAVRGDGQEALIGQLLPSRVFVTVRDAEGNPVRNAEVRFDVTSGDGIRAPSVTRTDSVGEASARWRLGMVEGVQRLTARAASLDERVVFTATALAQTELDGPGEEGPIETAPVRIQSATFAVGGSHVCAIASGVLRCRGGNDLGQAAVTESTRYVAVAAGAAHTCALDEVGAVSCWGANESGQLGDGGRSNHDSPTAVRTELRFATIAAGLSHTCGLAGGGVPMCWGQNLSGQLGDGTRNDQTVPITVGGGMIFRALVAGWSHTCGLTENGNAFCWGSNNQGQLGDGSTLDRLVPKLVRGAVERLVAGSTHTCGISDGDVLCWGGNTFGQLGDGTTTSKSQPVAVQGLPGRPIYLAAGAVHTCAVLQGGRAYCWGQNLQGQLGDGTTENRPTATEVSGGLAFSEIHAGGAQTCARTTAGLEYCWGLNQNGQLGDGTRANRSVPTRVGG